MSRNKHHVQLIRCLDSSVSVSVIPGQNTLRIVNFCFEELLAAT
jgi:hypothetical protein